ncbi:branched-chain-amino-acid aminotransferase-like isoform X1 [Ruditapes philippinarum]|uniref:branched-chain-amino-acid aminotransferase-like isoform X1 n=1 Tax=Ruditapes philippinarum TaxID=129788 RepID=UPI00295A9EC3|nr:branched-chain-amino-acid aminotransferase-like isoform X1 [Ruditapes philippinarum]
MQSHINGVNLQPTNVSRCFLGQCVQRQIFRCYASSTVPSFKAKDVEIKRTKSPAPKPDVSKLKFGHHFSDHMLEIDWTSENGWGQPVICPMHNFQIHPGAKCLHYATELFEGMKAYRGDDDKIRLFRPMENMKRMLSTSERACLPLFDGRELVSLIKKLISIDADWVPKATKDQPSSLYIRPTLIGTEPTLGVIRSNEAKLFVLVGPVGPYYPTGMAPVKLLADPQFVRAWPGGSGGFKMGCNYAPTLAIQKEAEKHGCQQVLWLFGDDHQLTEVGAMNLFTFWVNEQGEKELVTAPLNGLVLPGITRKSLLDLGRKWGEFKVTERDYTMKEVTKALRENRLLEMFGAGTACVVSPIEGISYQGEMLKIPTMSNPQITNRCMKELLDIQYGRTQSDWVEYLD